jgi:hypothetical protein
MEVYINLTDRKLLFSHCLLHVYLKVQEESQFIAPRKQDQSNALTFQTSSGCVCAQMLEHASSLLTYAKYRAGISRVGFFSVSENNKKKGDCYREEQSLSFWSS